MREHEETWGNMREYEWIWMNFFQQDKIPIWYSVLVFSGDSYFLSLRLHSLQKSWSLISLKILATWAKLLYRFFRCSWFFYVLIFGNSDFFVYCLSAILTFGGTDFLLYRLLANRSWLLVNRSRSVPIFSKYGEAGNEFMLTSSC